MEIKSYNLLFFLIMLSMAAFSQDKLKKDLPAINLDAEAYKRIFSGEQQRQASINSTLVFYDGKLCSLSDINFSDEEIKKSIKSIKLIKEPDSVKAILSERIKTVIVIERKAVEEN